MKQNQDWAAELSSTVGAEVKWRRKELKLSAAQLGERCAELGYPIPRNTIANLENGRKASLPVHELLVLARALESSPVELLTPLGTSVPVLPGAEVEAIDAALWLRGDAEAPSAAQSPSSDDGVPEVPGLLSRGDEWSLWLLHRDLVHQISVELYNERMLSAPGRVPGLEDLWSAEQAWREKSLERARNSLEMLLESLWGFRTWMLSGGLALPELPDFVGPLPPWERGEKVPAAERESRQKEAMGAFTWMYARYLGPGDFSGRGRRLSETFYVRAPF